jgi:hypothetical protein
MEISFKDLAVYCIIALTLAVGVNHYAKLNIAALMPIEQAMFPGTQATKHFDYGASKGASTSMKPECARLKTTGDVKTRLRENLRDAKTKKDSYKVREIEEKLRQIENAEREACR